MTSTTRVPSANGTAIPPDFPYASIMLHGRPQHNRDDFSYRHPKMERGKRAKIFAPFDALDGYSEAIKAKTVEYVDRIDLCDDEKREIVRRLDILHNLTYTARMARATHVAVTVTYYVPCTDTNNYSFGIRGKCETAAGVVWNVDADVRHTITVGKKVIGFDSIAGITADKEGLFELPWELEVP